MHAFLKLCVLRKIFFWGGGSLRWRATDFLHHRGGMGGGGEGGGLPKGCATERATVRQGFVGVSQIHRATGVERGGGGSSLVCHHCAAPRHGMGGVGGGSKTLCHAVPRRAADYAVH